MKRVTLLTEDRQLGERVAAGVDEEGVACEVAAGSEEDIAAVELRPPSLLILDLGLGESRVVALIGRLRRSLVGTAPDMLVLASEVEGDQPVRSALKAGAKDFLPVSSSTELIAVKVAHMLRVLRAVRISRRGAPQVIGRYLVERELGRGAMGVVYLARCIETDKMVALKTCLPSGEGVEDLLRFRREIDLMQALDHPRLVRVYSAGRHGRLYYYAMEFIDGITLAQRLRQAGATSERLALRILEALAEALAELHRHELIHRDVKPANVLIHRSRGPILTDFGLARHSADLQLTNVGQLVGTPRYMSPELVQGERADHRADLFSLGLVTIELLSGSRAVTGKTTWEVMQRIVAGKFPTGATLVEAGSCSPALGTLLDAMLAVERERRPGSAKAVAELARELLAAGG